ncbi:DUF779 domain-containing protein [Litorivicinus lipolyticus]|uniref:DUF779 domain-containing protein n=1 Tax=Litorivicinus lipolyticus TaxID=418701 RepID=A0A5Q2QHF6_9GAMM|nr:DUF779 domain-containing protein [Litorivicinus lipolyticus]QGG80455.1 DUF779 domain-containing protein [Litorivicinus lipolyticus]
MYQVARVSCTDATETLVASLLPIHGPLLFHQSGGCCDGSAPMCYPRGEFKVGSRDVYLGDVAGQPFYISESQWEYWSHTHLIIDVVAGRGGMFSVEGPTGQRFLTRSRLFTDTESQSMLSDTLLQGSAGIQGVSCTTD